MKYSDNPAHNLIIERAMLVADKEPSSYTSHAFHWNGKRGWLEITIGHDPFQYVRVFRLNGGDITPVTSKTRLVTEVSGLPDGVRVMHNGKEKIVKCVGQFMFLYPASNQEPYLPELVRSDQSSVEVTVGASQEGVLVGGELVMTRKEVTERVMHIDVDEFLMGCKFDILSLVKKERGCKHER